MGLALIYLIGCVVLGVVLGIRLRERRLVQQRLLALRKRHIAMLAGYRPAGRPHRTNTSRSA